MHVRPPFPWTYRHHCAINEVEMHERGERLLRKEAAPWPGCAAWT
ncbi:hypothetical protein TC41_0474 [Alicyclobacillus acidocaldarius subsp. acidocaldarius Tc-4-1]|uniref:Uncharacterized protein n=1 Tax=Alicyclobacillus acidocaldarius (strain Tc-4-1) TaxID=1048834 RepID=F8ICG3_ALIAT|nr:hypothetical protein TC41_0474 [Alicyclobacillus acidocaldarius subsp. acidocaldarius Tc-4-1]